MSGKRYYQVKVNGKEKIGLLVSAIDGPAGNDIKLKFEDGTMGWFPFITAQEVPDYEEKAGIF